MPKLKKLKRLHNLTPQPLSGAVHVTGNNHDVFYCVVADCGRGGDLAKDTFTEYVKRGSQHVVGILWKQPRLLSIPDLEVPMDGLMDANVEEAIRSLWDEWKEDDLFDKCTVKLVMSPLHGDENNKGLLLWSHDSGDTFAKKVGRDSVPGLPQRLENALSIAHEIGFRHIILHYCYSGAALLEFPRSMSEAEALRGAEFTSDDGTLTVCGYRSTEWSTEHPVGSTAATRYLRAGAPSSDRFVPREKVARGYVVAAHVAILTPVRSVGRHSSRNLEPTALAENVHFVGGGRYTKCSVDRYTKDVVTARLSGIAKKKIKGDAKALKGRRMTEATMLQIFQRRRDNGLVRVRRRKKGTMKSFILRGRVVSKDNLSVQIQFEKENGNYFTETFPNKKNSTYDLTHCERLDSN